MLGPSDTPPSASCGPQPGVGGRLGLRDTPFLQGFRTVLPPAELRVSEPSRAPGPFCRRGRGAVGRRGRGSSFQEGPLGQVEAAEAADDAHSLKRQNGGSF